MIMKPTVKFDENKIIDAIMTMCQITIDGDEKHSLEKVMILAVDIYAQIIKNLMSALQCEEHGPALIQEFILKSGLTAMVDNLEVH
jgi:hypothetical protein